MKPEEIAEEAAWAAIGVLGGTGDQGRGLARRLAMAGNRVIIGSRDAGRAAAAAAAVGSAPQVTGTENEEAARIADVVIAAMPWEGHADLLTQLAGALEGKILIDCVNPMAFDSHGAYPIPVPEGSAAQQAAALLTAARSRRSPATSSRSTGATRLTPACASPTSKSGPAPARKTWAEPSCPTTHRHCRKSMACGMPAHQLTFIVNNDNR